jgi:hypothetical protein
MQLIEDTIKENPLIKLASWKGCEGQAPLEDSKGNAIRSGNVGLLLRRRGSYYHTPHSLFDLTV